MPSLLTYFYLSEPIHKVQFNVSYPVGSTENQNENEFKPTSDLQENGTILKIVEETDFGPPSYENGGEKVIHFNENAEVVSNGSHSHDSDSGEEDATSL